MIKSLSCIFLLNLIFPSCAREASVSRTNEVIEENLTHDEFTNAPTTSPSPVLLSDRPGPNNTGVLPGTVLQPYTGYWKMVITQGGTQDKHIIYENLDITGRIDVQAPYVTIRNTRINSAGTFWSINVYSNGSPSDVLIEDVELFGASGCAVGGSGFTLRRANIHHTSGDGINPGSNTIIEDTWIHEIGWGEGAHSDSLQMTGGSNNIFRRNFFDQPINQGHSANSTILLGTERGPTNNILIEGNWLNGGNYTVQSNATNVRIRNNRFGRAYRYGLFRLWIPPIETSGNVWDDTGEPVE